MVAAMAACWDGKYAAGGLAAAALMEQDLNQLRPRGMVAVLAPLLPAVLMAGFSNANIGSGDARDPDPSHVMRLSAASALLTSAVMHRLIPMELMPKVRTTETACEDAVHATPWCGYPAAPTQPSVVTLTLTLSTGHSAMLYHRCRCCTTWHFTSSSWTRSLRCACTTTSACAASKRRSRQRHTAVRPPQPPLTQPHRPTAAAASTRRCGSPAATAAAGATRQRWRRTPSSCWGFVRDSLHGRARAAG